MPRQANQLKSVTEPERKATAPPARKKRKRRVLPGFITDGRLAKVTGFFSMLFGLYLVAAFISYLGTWRIDSNLVTGQDFGFLFDSSIRVQNSAGKIGAVLSNLLIRRGFGLPAFLIPALLFLAGFRLFFRFSYVPLLKTFNYAILFMLWASMVLGYFFGKDPSRSILGGIFGFESAQWLVTMLGRPGTLMILAFILISFLIVVGLLPFTRPGKRATEEAFAPSGAGVDEDDSEETKPEEPEEVFNTAEKPTVVDLKPDKGIELTIEKGEEETTDKVGSVSYGNIDSHYDPTLDLSDYRFPTLELLNDYHGEGVMVAKEELEANKDRIVETLNNYAIRIDKIKATIGPTVTLYEIIPAPGVRISRIKNLEDDIALSLSAMGIRIIAPIPGKGTIGIEVPNMKPEIVSIKSMLASERFRTSNFELPIALGKTISNESYIADLTRMPHILMAGATGQGKSVGLNAILLSLLYKKHPSQVKFVLVDPKKVELTLFAKIERHFLAKLPDSEDAIITDTRRVVRTLNSLGIEMDSRYELLKEAQVRNIKEYNTKFTERKLNPNEGHRHLPYIVLVVDEFADLIMTAGREIENPLTRLAQLARATGIHLVIATQRPSVNIITGTIKANFPARIAYRVISKVDSRTILDSSGADQLVGRGDMLLSTSNDLIRLQCAFVDTPEVERVTEFIGSQRAYPDALHLPEYYDEESEELGDFDPSERDELFEDAARLVVSHQQGSTSLIQRKLKLGYNRAGRIIDQLEAAGIVGPFEGSKARDVLVANEMALEQFLKDLYSRDTR